MIFKGTVKIGEIYHGGTLIGKVFKGKTKVWDVNPYEKGEVVSYQSPGKYEGTLSVGVWTVSLCGSGGSGLGWALEGYPWAANGGSGAFAEVTFYNPVSRKIVLFAPAGNEAGSLDGAAAYMELDGERMITAGGGTKGAFNSGGKGGVVTIAEALDVLSETKINGNDGGVKLSFDEGSGGESVSKYDEWGKGSRDGSNAGGLRLVYERHVR